MNAWSRIPAEPECCFLSPNELSDAPGRACGGGLSQPTFISWAQRRIHGKFTVVSDFLDGNRNWAMHFA